MLSVSKDSDGQKVASPASASGVWLSVSRSVCPVVSSDALVIATVVVKSVDARVGEGVGVVEEFVKSVGD